MLSRLLFHHLLTLLVAIVCSQHLRLPAPIFLRRPGELVEYHCFFFLNFNHPSHDGNNENAATQFSFYFVATVLPLPVNTFRHVLKYREHLLFS
ncbi:hypothetical protein TTRE_0000250901 [Trichuris trichiura]|uniref:Secreted protein n=1 Tax=Trichuris trichiura TaxID=36087 RepID=A0A077Z333_TRITR|nr:hypothetical protein TTRE_0000250901 [Trichuris trichiura]